MAQRQFRSDDTDKWAYGFGNGSDGSTYTVPANEGCSGTSGGTALTLAAAGSFANGMLVLIHQTRGTGVGTWELNKISSGGGTTSLVMARNLQNTYTDSGNSQAQIIQLKQYNNLTTEAITAPSWDGSKGGIIAFFDKETATINGSQNLTGKGFVGGVVGANSQVTGKQGESTTNTGANSRSANGMAGGGGDYGINGNKSGGGGAGGGHATSGTNGNNNNASSSLGGIRGGTGGTASLVTMVFGGAGASAGGINNYSNPGDGGNSGGMAFIFAKNIVVTGSIPLNGNNGTNGSGDTGGGGGGAGGSCLLKCETATLGTNLITANAGAGGARAGDAGAGGAGAVGRIHIDYSVSYTGTTTPTIDARLDTTIKAGGAGFFAFF